MFAVIWQPSAIDDLAAAWVGATDRQAITDAADRVERLLARAPAAQGESRPRNRRIMFDRPLVVTYEIRAASREVVILGVRTY